MTDAISMLSPGIKKDPVVSLGKLSKDYTELEWASGCPEVTWAQGGGPGAPKKFTLYIAQHQQRFSVGDIIHRRGVEGEQKRMK